MLTRILQHNLQPRLKLLRIALGTRFIYPPLVDMARAYGIDYQDLRGNIGALDLAARVSAGAPESDPDFSAMPGLAETMTPAGAPMTFNAEPSVARFIGQVVFRLRARTVVELGCFIGWTTAHIAVALKAMGHGTVYCVDPSEEYLTALRANMRAQAVQDYVIPLQGLSLDTHVLDGLPQQADVIFLDTSHAYPATRDEILTYAPRLTARGCLILHDSTSAPGVRRSIEEIRDAFDVHTFTTERSNGVTVLFRRQA